MLLDTERIENLLVDCVESRNEHQFEYILNELRISPNKKLKCFDGLSTFEKVLMLPDSRRFIEICMHTGCDFYKKSRDGIYPIRYAIDSFCADNLNAILAPSKADPLADDNFLAAQYSAIINEKMYGGNNYLHIVISRVTKDNYQELSKMIKAMLMNGCNVNLPNEQQETPFYLLLKNSIVDNGLINFVIENARIDFYTFNSKEIGSLMEKKGLAARLSIRNDFVVDKNYMTQHIGNWNDKQLIANLELWRKNSKDFDNEILDLMEVAIVRNLPETVALLMEIGVEINGISKNSKFRMTPGFLACALGHYQVLKVLLNNQSLSFKSSKLKRNLLHQIFASESLDFNDRQRSFDLIIADQRCTLNIINQTDADNQVPLFLACKYECDAIVKELLRRGAYIGHESVLNYIKKDTLAEFLDESVKCSGDSNDRECEIYVDYKFLMPPDRKTLEITSVHLISSNSSLQDFVLHPVISSFVFLKWRKIDYIVYFNLLLYFGFMIFLGFIIVNFYYVSGEIEYDKEYCQDIENSNKLSEWVYEIGTLSSSSSRNTFTRLLFENLEQFKELKKYLTAENYNEWSSSYTDMEWKTRFRQHFHEHSLSYWLGISGLVFLAAYEVVQCVMSFKKYFFKPINWLDISLIAFSFFVLIEGVDVGRDNFKQTCAIMILLMGAQSIQLFSKVSAFSLSLHMAILNKVCRTFLKTIAPYLIIISAFGMSFFALNYEDITTTDESNPDGTYFSNPFISTISTVRMMLSDFGAVTINEKDHFKGTLFLAFMISISIILFNLLNALAISDTNEMMQVAEFVETRKRISTLRSYETLFSVFKLTHANVFPKLNTILLTPNKNRVVKVKQTVRMSDNVTIAMQKPEKLPEFDHLYADWLFWKSKSEPLQFGEKLISKILIFAKDQQQKDLHEMDKIMNNKELCAIKEAQQDIHKNMDKILNNRELRAIIEAQQDIYKELLKISNRAELKP